MQQCMYSASGDYTCKATQQSIGSSRGLERFVEDEPVDSSAMSTQDLPSNEGFRGGRAGGSVANGSGYGGGKKCPNGQKYC